MIQEGALHGLRYFWTLTMGGTGDPCRGNAKRSRAAAGVMWNRVHSVVRKWHGGGFPYLVVVEAQQDGTAHVHAALPFYAPREVLHEAWARAGGGFTWVERADVQRAPAYLAKYLTKYLGMKAPWDEKVSDGRGGWKWRPWRRWWAARGVVVLECHTSTGEWSLVRAEAWEWFELVRSLTPDSGPEPPSAC